MICIHICHDVSHTRVFPDYLLYSFSSISIGCPLGHHRTVYRLYMSYVYVYVYVYFSVM